VPSSSMSAWLVGAIDYTTLSTSSPLFEPVDEHTFRVSPDFLKDADSVGICWQRRSSLAVRPDSEAFTVAIALLALAGDDQRLHEVDAIRVFVNWRDGALWGPNIPSESKMAAC
jgi:hypothetical protein